MCVSHLKINLPPRRWRGIKKSLAGFDLRVAESIYACTAIFICLLIKQMDVCKFLSHLWDITI